MSTVGPGNLEIGPISALIAGGNPWLGSAEQHEAWQRMIAVVEVVALGAGAAAVWHHHDTTPPWTIAVAAAGVVALALLTVFPVARALGRATWPQRYRVALALRTGLVAIAVGALCIVLPGWTSLWALPIAIGAGADAVLTCNEIGWAPQPLRWWRRFLVGPLHAAMVGVMTVTGIVADPATAITALIAFACLHAWLFTAMVSAWLLCDLGRQHVGERTRALDEVVRNDRRERAHWLHDDICAELHAVALQLQTRRLQPEEAVHLIEQVDHRLRVRQLDELLDSGRARVGEILQPFIRRVHNAGLTITSVPSYETCATLLQPTVARLASRATAELTSNVLESGATEIAYGVSIDDATGRLLLTVSDNGPGFGLSEVPTGRALWALRKDLVDGGLTIGESSSGGAIVTAEIPLWAGGARGFATAGR